MSSNLLQLGQQSELTLPFPVARVHCTCYTKEGSNDTVQKASGWKHHLAITCPNLYNWFGSAASRSPPSCHIKPSNRAFMLAVNSTARLGSRNRLEYTAATNATRITQMAGPPPAQLTRQEQHRATMMMPTISEQHYWQQPPQQPQQQYCMLYLLSRLQKCWNMLKQPSGLNFRAWHDRMCSLSQPTRVWDVCCWWNHLS